MYASRLGAECWSSLPVTYRKFTALKIEKPTTAGDLAPRERRNSNAVNPSVTRLSGPVATSLAHPGCREPDCSAQMALSANTTRGLGHLNHFVVIKEGHVADPRIVIHSA